MSRSRIPELAKRIKKDPDDSFSKFALALELLKISEIPKARTLFEDIVRKDPEYVGVYYHLAALYVESGENNKAINTYKEGIKVAGAKGDQHALSELRSAFMNLQLETDD
ncbi:tetratricopeptide repeat protein [Balneola sp. MJW-20]|uniref:tetratricopeptide repeat protein n=1 Tax=Gracilimonas aurantiaca TaxID=3234185 RepID=UPI00346530E7